MILPQAHAEDFLRFCQRNAQSCPVLSVSDPGDPLPPGLGADIDIRTDVPRYRVWRDGELVDEPRVGGSRILLALDSPAVVCHLSSLLLPPRDPYSFD